jgi:preprotein translocase subunit SecG
MLTIAGISISLCLIILIGIRIPPQDLGLSSFANNSNLLGSPGSAQRFLDLLTVSLILVYFLIAFQLNIQVH